MLPSGAAWRPGKGFFESEDLRVAEMSGELGKDAGKEIGERPGVQRLGRRIFEAPGGDGVNEVRHEWGGRSKA